ncbi:MAG: pyrimidine dimer DNA glycosylase/endonuclease V [Tidjanibacter sp.]|nr:pyrimidine dimer DNA glycosylase/endonuclease V [Tidjanibacter sp.]
MRLWSINPAYLDASGLVALWRESLLARQVLRGLTKGYCNHPQLIRFRRSVEPLWAIEYYLQELFLEAERRGYNFDATKFRSVQCPPLVDVTKGQMEYELSHLRNKLMLRSPLRHIDLLEVTIINPHPLFNVVEGEVESWERL